MGRSPDPAVCSLVRGPHGQPRRGDETASRGSQPRSTCTPRRRSTIIPRVKDPWADDARQLHRELDELLARQLDDRSLRDALDTLSGRRGLPLVFYRLVRPLLERDPVLFAPLIRPRLEYWGYDANGKQIAPWKTPEGQRDLDWLLGFADDRDDIPLFRQAMLIWLAQFGRQRNQHFCQQLRWRFERARSAHQQASVLARFADLGTLDDETALALYEHAPDLVKDYLRRHVPYRLHGGTPGDVWPQMLAKTRRDDEDFHFALYRRVAGTRTWQADVRRLLQEASNEKLVDELERRHPEQFTRQAGKIFHQVLEARGSAALGYVMRHLPEIYRGGWGDDGYGPLLRMAKKRAYETLWAGLLRHAATVHEYNTAVRQLAREGDSDARRRLEKLAGLGRELNFPGLGLARVQPLDDETACALFQHHPDLLLGPFRPHLFAGWNESYPRLVELALAAEQNSLLDYLASRLVTRGGRSLPQGLAATTETLCRHYEALLADPKHFADRAANVLGQVPPYVVWSYDSLLETNRLARLLYEHATADYLASSSAVRDLLEAPEIHAQAVALRALAQPDPRAQRLAAEHLDVLVPTLLRPLHRRTRLAAFGALSNATSSETGATRVLTAAREALYLPDRGTPKEEIVGLIGEILARYPALRGPQETPIVYGRPACSS